MVLQTCHRIKKHVILNKVFGVIPDSEASVIKLILISSQAGSILMV